MSKSSKHIKPINAYKAAIIKHGRRVTIRGRIYFEREVLSRQGSPVIQRVRVY